MDGVELSIGGLCDFIESFSFKITTNCSSLVFQRDHLLTLHIKSQALPSTTKQETGHCVLFNTLMLGNFAYFFLSSVDI